MTGGKRLVSMDSGNQVRWEDHMRALEAASVGGDIELFVKLLAGSC